MKPTQHTPTPYAVGRSGQVAGFNSETETRIYAADEQGQGIDQDIDGNVYCLGITFEKEDAAFIVKACNSHDALFNACREALSLLNDPNAEPDDATAVAILLSEALVDLPERG